MVHDLNPKNPHINGLFLPWGGDPINTQIDINQLAQINILVYTGAHIRMALIAVCRTSFVTTDMLNFSKKKDNTKINMILNDSLLLEVHAPIYTKNYSNMSQKEGETIFLVTLWSLISRSSVQNIMRIFWVSRIYTQNGPQNIFGLGKQRQHATWFFVIVRVMTKISMQNFMKKYSTILKI